MKIDFDPLKNARNIEERGLSFERVAEFDFHTAIFTVDNRRVMVKIVFRLWAF